MSDLTPEDVEIDIDEFFGTEQTDQARLEIKVSYSALYKGRPYYPEARYGDGPRMQVVGDEDDQQVIIESEADLRARVIRTALDALAAAQEEFLINITNTEKETK